MDARALKQGDFASVYTEGWMDDGNSSQRTGHHLLTDAHQTAEIPTTKAWLSTSE